MSYTENYKGIKVDIQAVDITIKESVIEVIHESLDKLLRFTPEINFAEIYLKHEDNHKNENKYVRFRVAIPGPDVFAEASADHWEPAIREATQKLKRQLEKAKESS